jgi:hypothetical protein
MAASKMLREASPVVTRTEDEDDLFDFGDPEIISVELCPGKFLSLREPSANELIEITKVSENKNISEVEATLQTICILHAPDAGKRRFSLKDAKRLRPRQLKKLGSAINELLGLDSKDSDEDSDNE